MGRIYRERELRPGGVRSGVFTTLALVADKPFLRKVCGLNSHNADAFGGPFCNCHDEDVYSFQFGKEDHYGKISFEDLCHRAHVPVWQALDEPEPPTWTTFTDPCSGEVVCTDVP